MFKDLPSLYKLPPGTCCWGGGADTSGMEQAAQQAAMIAQQMYGEAKTYMKPYTDIGSAATTTTGGLLGLPGYAAVDPTQQLESTPGYKFLQDQGTKALSRYGAATGLSLSGPAALSAQHQGQGLAQSYAWAPYMSALMGQQQLGYGGATNVGNWGVQTGQIVGQDLMAAAQANYMGQVQRANAQNAMWGDIFGGVGALGGAILGMPGIGSAIGGMFGGGGGGGGGYGGGGFTSPGFTAYSSMGSPMTVPYGVYYADGGHTTADRPIVVGERGAEVFVPSTDGFIIPNHLLPYSSFGEAPSAFGR